MRDFIWIFKHYIKVALAEKENLLMIILPLAFIILNGVINGDTELVDGFNPVMTAVAPMFMLSFQFFGCAWIADYLHRDFKGPVHWRLHAAPIDQRIYFAAIGAASWIFNLLTGGLIIAVTALFFNADWGNYGIVFLVLLLVSLMSQFIGLLMFYLVKDYSMINTIMYIIGFGMMLFSGVLFIPISGHAALNYLRTHTPLSLGWNAILGTSFFREGSINGAGIIDVGRNIMILVGMTGVLGVVAGIFGRRTNRDNL
jgi:ABC-type transport system involved in cytochrome c biogenesis permease component